MGHQATALLRAPGVYYVDLMWLMHASVRFKPRQHTPGHTPWMGTPLLAAPASAIDKSVGGRLGLAAKSRGAQQLPLAMMAQQHALGHWHAPTSLYGRARLLLWGKEHCQQRYRNTTEVIQVLDSTVQLQGGTAQWFLSPTFILLFVTRVYAAQAVHCCLIAGLPAQAVLAEHHAY